MSEQELQALLAEWQERLRVQDWRLTVRLGRHHEIREGTAANLDLNLQRRSARITILDPNDHEPEGDQTMGVEELLVHELLHLLFLSLDDDLCDHQEDAFEQALNALAAALVKLKREAE